MSGQPDGGPAFPQVLNTGLVSMTQDGALEVDKEAVGGMSLRDWFAGQALAALLSNPSATVDDGIMAEKAFPEAAYKMADAMIAARQAPAAVPTPRGEG